LVEKLVVYRSAPKPIDAPTASTVSLISAKVRRCVPRLSRLVVYEARPVRSAGSSRLPTCR
jgi:hypothetical protein